MLNDRSEKISSALSQAAESQRRASETAQETERQLAQAREESAGIIASAQRAAEAQRQTLDAQARQDAQNLASGARDAIDRERRAAVDELRREAGLLAVSTATQVVRQGLDEGAAVGRPRHLGRRRKGVAGGRDRSPFGAPLRAGSARDRRGERHGQYLDGGPAVARPRLARDVDRRTLDDPKMGQSRRTDEARKRLADHVSPLALNLVLLLIKKGRAGLVPRIADAFERLENDRSARITAEVTSAIPLTAAQRAGLTVQLGRRTGKTVSLDERVDPRILGD